MKESAFRRRVVQLLVDVGAFAVENTALPGTPDVAYLHGWIELKVLRTWPKRADGIVRMPHFVARQRVWHFNWHRHGGISFILIKIEDDILLIPGRHAYEIGFTTRPVLEAMASAKWKSLREMDNKLLAFLQEGH